MKSQTFVLRKNRSSSLLCNNYNSVAIGLVISVQHATALCNEGLMIVQFSSNTLMIFAVLENCNISHWWGFQKSLVILNRWTNPKMSRLIIRIFSYSLFIYALYFPTKFALLRVFITKCHWILYLLWLLLNFVYLLCLL